MPISPDDLLVLSRELLTQNNEVAARSAVSRSYYAVYHAAKLHADNMNVIDQEANFHKGTHERLTDRYKMIGDVRGRQIAAWLFSMHQLRVTADYTLDCEFDENLVKTHFQSACKLLDKLATP